MDVPPEDKCIVLFDGFCHFCSGSVTFLLKRDPAANFLFAASQSPAGRELLERNVIGEVAAHSLILICGREIYRKSEAALRIARGMGGLWPLFYAFRIIPRRLRDAVYDRVARRRYRLFGKRESCYLPDPAFRERFLPDPGYGPSG